MQTVLLLSVFIVTVFYSRKSCLLSKACTAVELIRTRPHRQESHDPALRFVALWATDSYFIFQQHLSKRTSSCLPMQSSTAATEHTTNKTLQELL